MISSPYTTLHPYWRASRRKGKVPARTMGAVCRVGGRRGRGGEVEERREEGREGWNEGPHLMNDVHTRTKSYRVVVEALNDPLERGRRVESGSGGGWWWGDGETDIARYTALRDSARARIPNASVVASFVCHARACPGCGCGRQGLMVSLYG